MKYKHVTTMNSRYIRVSPSFWQDKASVESPNNTTNYAGAIFAWSEPKFLYSLAEFMNE